MFVCGCVDEGYGMMGGVVGGRVEKMRGGETTSYQRGNVLYLGVSCEG